MGGAGGEITGPDDIYAEPATHLQAGGVEGLRLEYRTPKRLDECV